MKKFYIDWPFMGLLTALVATVVAIVIITIIHYKNENEWKQDCAARGGLVVEAHDSGVVCVDENRKMIK